MEYLPLVSPPVTDSKMNEFSFAPANFNMIDTGVSKSEVSLANITWFWPASYSFLNLEKLGVMDIIKAIENLNELHLKPARLDQAWNAFLPC